MSPTERPEQVRQKKPFLSLLTDVPHLIVQLMRAELELLKAELVSKLKSIGIGLGLFVISLTLISLASLLFIFAGVFALSLVVPLWAAALIAGGGVLLIAIVFAGAGAAAMASTSSPAPNETIESIRRDIRVIRGQK
jgi:hypothetical protein